MLSFAATRSLRSLHGNIMPSQVSRAGGLVLSSKHIVDQSLISRIEKETSRMVICRFRHSFNKPRRFQNHDGVLSEFSPAGHFGGEEFIPAGRFGGEEFGGTWEVQAVKHAVERFKKPQEMQQLLEAMGTPTDKAVELIRGFSKKVLRGKVAEVNKSALAIMAEDSLEAGMTFKAMGKTKEEAISTKLDKALWNAFIKDSEHLFPPETQFRLSRMREVSDLRYPSEWNPSARLLKRKIIMHVGPTNSGKTHNALKRLRSAESGTYLSPLRLLAHEIFERMNKDGTPCNLVTGEERRFGVVDENGKPDPAASKVVSCTVEMVNLNRKVEVAVIDEIQMMVDPDRGWAWTQALLGLPAQEIHLCGEPTVVELVKKICSLTNEDVIVNNYERLSKLEVQDESLHGNLRNVQKGDCVVSFSRKNIFRLKKAIEAETGLRCAVAYGSLPPESRSTQARLFNEPDSGYDVLVASDAIGMGLNLNIRRIIFEAVEKFDGQVLRSLSITQLKQIAGRAGRFGTDYDVGKATTLVQGDMAALKRAIAAPMVEINRAAIQPTAEMIEEFAVQMPGAPFSHVLRMFEMVSQNSSIFFPGQFRNMIDAAKLIDKISMPTRERIPFISAPIQTRDPTVVTAAIQLGNAVGKGKAISIDDVVKLPEQETKLELQRLESSHRIIMLYLWLSQRFGNVMQGSLLSDAVVRKARCEELINIALEQSDDKKIKNMRKKLGIENEDSTNNALESSEGSEGVESEEKKVRHKKHKLKKNTPQG
ncbi:RNA helicase [Entomortierella beljakovae]|nr:RNA helicase [Entomortierella beljakovae]